MTGKQAYLAKLKQLLDSAGYNPGPYFKHCDAEWLAESKFKYGTPVLSQAVFLRECWKTVFPAGDVGAAQAFIKDLRSRRLDWEEQYECRQARLHPEFLTQLEALLQTPDRDALLYMFRSLQIQAIFSVICLLDGGMGVDEGGADDWQLCGNDGEEPPEGQPETGQSFGNIKEEFWFFDPDNNNASSLG